MWNEMFNKLPWNDKIRTLRIFRGKTQEQLAKECLTNRKGWWNWESGSHYPRQISQHAIAKALDVKVQDIFGEKKKTNGRKAKASNQ